MAIQNSELDFFEIKSQLKTYLKQQNEFQDYDFNASGLSNILDVLAHNTHINGLTANLAINESFLSSAQLRSSVVSHAETLGYLPKSQTASTAIISVTLTVAGGPATLTIPKGTEFTSSVSEVVYSFITIEDCIASNESGTYVFKTSSGSDEIILREGRTKTKSFIVGDVSDDSVYVIPDDTLDTSTMSVKVYDNYLSGTFQVYKDINTVATIDEDSKVFIVREAANGYYEMFFSDGNILGTAPAAGNRIDIEYISSLGSKANGAKVFESSITLEDEDLSPVTVAMSAGGSEKESINSIKLNAPRSFSTQNRLVTANDYTSLIQSRYGSYIEDVVAWGGNDNIPPQYGKVFVSLKFLDGVGESVKTDVKSQIHDQLTANLSIMSIDTVFVEPDQTFLELQTVFNIDPIKNPSSTEALQSTVNAFIAQYTLDNLNTFGSVFRRSNLLTEIDNLSTSILNSRISVRVQQRIDIDTIIEEIEAAQTELSIPFDTYIEQDHTVSFPVRLASPDKDEHVVTTSVFKSNGINVTVKNELGSTRLQLVDMNGIVKITNVGSYDPAKGTVSLVSVKIDKEGYVGTGLKVTATPANQSTVSPLRNYIISLDEDLSFTSGFIDTGATKVQL